MVYFEMFLTQILGGEGWNEVSNPIIHLAPWALILFTASVISMELTILNLVLKRL